MDIARVPLPEYVDSSLLLAFPGLNHRGVSGEEEPQALLSLRAAGDMRYFHRGVNPHREKYFGRWGIEASRVLGIKLAHSRSILFPSDRADQERLVDEAIDARGGADGVLARDPRLVPTVTAADCMPIWILDRHSGVFGVLHSGWRGTGILTAAVEELGRRFGSPASAISAILGPAIGSCCYDVPEERARGFLKLYGDRAAFADGGRWRIDLREANIVIAERSGIGALLSVDACTSCDPRLGSYRREGPEHFTCMAAACGMFERPAVDHA
jgi:YfiH family protein